jgi:hypothetical protein
MSPKLKKVKNHPGIYRRGSRYVVTWRERSGKQRRQSAGTLAEAGNLKAKNRNQRGPSQRIRFNTYAPLWLEGYRGRGRHRRRDAQRLRALAGAGRR